METCWYTCEARGAVRFPIFAFPDRRVAGLPNTRWMPLASVEKILYGGSTGAVHRLLARESQSLSILSVKKATVVAGLVTATEHRELLEAFAETLDDETRRRVRNISLIPLPVVVSIARAYGRSAHSSALLASLSARRPREWEVAEELEANEANNEVDYVLLDEAQELEEADVALQAELHHMVPFVEVEADEAISRSYMLAHVPSALRAHLEAYKAFRQAPLNRLREGGMVVDVTVAHDISTGLRFFGYLEREKRVAPTIRSLASPSLGEWAQHFCDFLRDRGCQYSTCANYLSCLINMTQWAWDTMPVEEAALALTPQPPEQLLRLRAQCEAHARQDRLWQRKSAGWIDFEDAQKARVKAIDACEKRPSIKLLREVVILHFLTCQPPDRVGIVRRLRFGATLKPTSGGYELDLTETRGAHKTARFYGPSRTTISGLITPWLRRYLDALQLERMEESGVFYIFPVGTDCSRCISSSQWSTMVKALFQTYAGVPTTPKVLRASYITWLKSQTEAPEVLKSAATAMRHTQDTQGSDRYDKESNDRLVAAAVSYTEAYAARFQPGGGASAGPSASHSTSSTAPTSNFHLVKGQPRVFTFRAEAKLGDGATRTFVCKLGWLDDFAPGCTLRFPSFPGRTDGFTFQLPSDSGRTMRIKATVDKEAMRLAAFGVSRLQIKRDVPTVQAVPCAPPPTMPRPSEPVAPSGPSAAQARPMAAIHALLGRRLQPVEAKGDCFPLSAMCGFELSAQQVAAPDEAARATLRAVRESAVDRIALAKDIDGVEAGVVRSAEALPKSTAAAQKKMAPWRNLRYWLGEPGLSTAFMFAVAIHLQRPIVVLERLGESDYVEPARVYGMREGSRLRRTPARAGVPETIPFYFPLPFAQLPSTAADGCSVVRYDRGASHFEALVPSSGANASDSAKKRPRPQEEREQSIEQALGGVFTGLRVAHAPPSPAELEAITPLVGRHVCFHWEEWGWACGKLAPCVAKHANFAVTYADGWKEEHTLRIEDYGQGGYGSWVLLEGAVGTRIDDYERGRYLVRGQWRRAPHLAQFTDGQLAEARAAASDARRKTEQRRADDELGAPFAEGQCLFVRAWAAGSGAWFRATVIGVRRRFPPIRVRYTSTIHGDTNPLLLPFPTVAFVSPSAVRTDPPPP